MKKNICKTQSIRFPNCDVIQEDHEDVSSFADKNALCRKILRLYSVNHTPHASQELALQEGESSRRILEPFQNFPLTQPPP